MKEILLTGIKNDNFQTLGKFSKWKFEGCLEKWSRYEDGLPFVEWKDKNVNGINDSLKRHGFNVTEGLLESIYKSVSLKDWRKASCGGCI